MTAGRSALIVAVDEYSDPGLRRLVAPTHDAEALADVLGRPAIGDFDVEVLRNASAQEVRVAVEDFFADRRPDDVLVLHFSCHGLKSPAGDLFLAANDSRPDRLASTAIAADFVNRQMADSRAQRIALFLDCCYGGAFPRGMVVRAGGDVQVRETFAEAQAAAGGRGRVVVTASSAVEYAFEGGQLADGDLPGPSVFTGSLVAGLATGEADRDGDGWVGLNELFSFVAERVRRSTTNQTPHLWSFGSEGDLLLAHSGRRRVIAEPPAAELVEAAGHPLTATRLGVAHELRDIVLGADVARALGAWELLGRLADDDSRRVAGVAVAARDACALRAEPSQVVLHAEGTDAASATVRLDGPPLALAATVTTSEPWLSATLEDSALALVGTTGRARSSSATVVLTSPIGELRVPVTLVGAPPVAPPAPAAPEPPPVSDAEEPAAAPVDTGPDAPAPTPAVHPPLPAPSAPARESVPVVAAENVVAAETVVAPTKVTAPKKAEPAAAPVTVPRTVPPASAVATPPTAPRTSTAPVTGAPRRRIGIAAAGWLGFVAGVALAGSTLSGVMAATAVSDYNDATGYVLAAAAGLVVAVAVAVVLQRLGAFAGARVGRRPALVELVTAAVGVVATVIAPSVVGECGCTMASDNPETYVVVAMTVVVTALAVLVIVGGALRRAITATCVTYLAWVIVLGIAVMTGNQYTAFGFLTIIGAILLATSVLLAARDTDGP